MLKWVDQFKDFIHNLNHDGELMKTLKDSCLFEKCHFAIESSLNKGKNRSEKTG